MYNYRKLLLLVALLPFMLVACTSNDKTETTNGQVISERLDAKSFHGKLSETPNAQLVDVRTPEEYNSGHIESSLNLNVYDSNFDKEISKLDKSKPVFLYCRSGGRSSSAASKLVDMGFTEIYDLQGGITAWNANGLKLSFSGSSKQKDSDGQSGSSTEEGLTGMDGDKYLQLISNNEKLVLVDFNAEWCGPCKKLSPILDKLAKEYSSKIELVKIDVDHNPIIAKQLRIEGLPTLKMYKNGKEVWNYLGLTDEESIKEVIKSNS
ncbi:MAG: thioredoxin [Candidatus Kapaibacterium sp.]